MTPVRKWMPALAILLVLSVGLTALWPVAVSWTSDRVAWAGARLLRKHPDVVRADTTGDDAAVVLTNERRLRVRPMLVNAASLAIPVYVSLAVASLFLPGGAFRMRTTRGARAFLAAGAVVIVSEALAGWLAIGYAIAVESGHVPGAPLRLATVATSAARSFVPFAALGLVLLHGRRSPTRRSGSQARRRG